MTYKPEHVTRILYYIILYCLTTAECIIVE